MTEGNYPPPGQPPQGPGQYGPQQGGYAPPPPGPYGTPAGKRTFGSVGLAVTAIGAIAVILAFTVFDWFKHANGHAHFSDLKTAADAGSGVATMTKLYFDWLGWVLLVAAVVTAVLACLPIVASKVWQLVGLLVGLVSVGLTFLAIKGNGSSYSATLKQTTVGFYVAAAGFLVLGIGAAIGSRKN
jgi:magnesium-transporting ATPase (P-type)